MKKIAIILALMLPAAAFGQSFSTGARASVGVDYKIKKGLHIEAREEMRMADNFAGLSSLRTTLGVTYKPLDFLKVGVGYTLINPYKINKELDNDALYTGPGSSASPSGNACSSPTTLMMPSTSIRAQETPLH